MNGSAAQFVKEVMAGQTNGLTGISLRAGLRLLEPFYAGVMRVRNMLYDRGVLPSYGLRVPVISVGNITTGGTGKTPVVRWLAEQLRSRGKHPAVLLRGYKRDHGDLSDEQALLQGYLNNGHPTPVVVHAQADRVAGAQQVAAEHPEVDVFILDDGFQHRRLRRDFDLVLIDATHPFGYGHVLPRGLLREPMSGLARADAFLLTRSDQVPPHRVDELSAELRRWNPHAPVYQARHAHTGLRSADDEQTISIQDLSHRNFFAFAGIGQPSTLDRQLAQFGQTYRGHCWFEDHHDYSDADLTTMRQRAHDAGAEVLLVTEKDWVKIQRLASARDTTLPIWRLEVQIALEEPAAANLLSLIETSHES